jgi:hypothetical protein
MKKEKKRKEIDIFDLESSRQSWILYLIYHVYLPLNGIEGRRDGVKIIMRVEGKKIK